MKRLMTIAMMASLTACGGGHVSSETGDLSASAPDLATTTVVDLSTALDAAPEDLEAPPDLAPLACAAATLDGDQSNYSSNYFFNGGDTVDQAFVPGRTGNLAAVSVGICPRIAPAKYGTSTLSFSLTKGTQVLAAATLPLSTLTTCTPRFDFACVPVSAGETMHLHVTSNLAKNVCTNSFCPLLNSLCQADWDCGLLSLQSSPPASPPYTVNGAAPNSQGALVYATYVQ